MHVAGHEVNIMYNLDEPIHQGTFLKIYAFYSLNLFAGNTNSSESLFHFAPAVFICLTLQMRYYVPHK